METFQRCQLLGMCMCHKAGRSGPVDACSSKLKELEWLLGTNFWTLSNLRLTGSLHFIISVFSVILSFCQIRAC